MTFIILLLAMSKGDWIHLVDFRLLGRLFIFLSSQIFNATRQQSHIEAATGSIVYKRFIVYK